jgi:hypothetical protein
MKKEGVLQITSQGCNPCEANIIGSKDGQLFV